MNCNQHLPVGKRYFPAFNFFRLPALLIIAVVHAMPLPYFVGAASDGTSAIYAITFFMMLSGFLMARTEIPEPITAGFIGGIAWKKLIRFYPLHLLTATACLWIIPLTLNGETFLCCATLTQSLIPDPQFYYAYNGVSWYLSTIFWLSLAYPVIAGHALFFLPATLLLLAGAAAAVPERMCEALYYISPIGNLLKFTLGILLYRLVNKVLESHTGTGVRERAVWTVLEVLALLLLWWWYAQAWPLFSAVTRDIQGTPGAAALLWRNLPLVPMMVLIFVFAMGKGWISRFFSAKIFEFFSKFTFAAFMIHVLFFRTLERFDLLYWCPQPARMTVYILLLLPTAMLVYYAYERPATILLRKIRPGAAAAGRLKKAVTPLIFLLLAGTFLNIILPPLKEYPVPPPQISCDHTLPTQFDLYNERNYLLHPGEKQPSRAVYKLTGLPVDEMTCRVKTVAEPADVRVNFYVDGKMVKSVRLQGIADADVKINLNRAKELIIESDKNGVINCDCMIVEEIIFRGRKR